MKIIRFLAIFIGVIVCFFETQGQVIRTYTGFYPSLTFYNFPTGLAVDTIGDLFIADVSANQIFGCLRSPVLTSLAGSDSDSVGYRDGADGTSLLNGPVAIAVSAGGAKYFCDRDNQRIRTIIPGYGFYVGTAAGNGTMGYSGDGGPAIDAELDEPSGIAVNNAGNIFISDAGNNVIRMIDSWGYINTIAGGCTGTGLGDGGPATGACFNLPGALCFDRNGNLYISDQLNYCIRKIDTSGIITTVVGTPGTNGFSGDGGPATAAVMDIAGGICIDRSGNLYFTDGNALLGDRLMPIPGNYRIRKVSTSGIITTIAGNGTRGESGDYGPATAAQFMFPDGIAVDTNGYIYLSDPLIPSIRVIDTCHGPYLDTIRGLDSLCIGSAITVTESVAGGSWSISDISIATISSSGVVHGVSNGVVTVTYSSTTPCGLILVQKTITVNPYPGYIYGDYAPICSGDSVRYSETLAGGTWSSSNTAIASVSPSGLVRAADTGSVIISYSLATTCGTAVATWPTTVTEIPHPGTITGTTTICRSGTVTVVDSVAGGRWSTSDSTLATIDSSGVVTIGSRAGVDTIIYTVSNRCGSASTRHAMIIEAPLSAGSVTGGTSVCAGSVITLSDTARGGTWSSSSTATATVTGSGVVTGVIGGIVTITYSVANSCGTATAVHDVTVNPLAVAGTLHGAGTICEDSLVTLTVTGGAAGGTWTTSSAAVATVNSAGLVRGVTGGSATVTYTVTNSCGSEYTTMGISVTPRPTVAAITGASSICPGLTETLRDGTAGGVWTSSSTAVATVNSSGLVTAVGGGTTTISYTVSNSCGSTTTTALFTVDPTPVVDSITGASGICAGDGFTLSDASAGGTWSSTNTSIATVSTTGLVYGVAAGVDTIKYTLAYYCGLAIASHLVTITPAAYAGTISGLDSICPGDTTTLFSTVPAGTWSSSNTAAATISSLGLVTGIATGTTNIVYAVTNSCGTVNAVYPFEVRSIYTCPEGIASVIRASDLLTIFPNPNTGFFTLQLTSATTEEATVRITNLTGQLVKELKMITNKPLDIELAQPAGVYFVRVASAGGKWMEKVVVE